MRSTQTDIPRERFSEMMREVEVNLLHLELAGIKTADEGVSVAMNKYGDAFTIHTPEGMLHSTAQVAQRIRDDLMTEAKASMRLNVATMRKAPPKKVGRPRKIAVMTDVSPTA